MDQPARITIKPKPKPTKTQEELELELELEEAFERDLLALIEELNHSKLYVKHELQLKGNIS